MNAYLDAMRRYASFSGRSTRSQFWLYTLFFGILLVVAAIVDGVIEGPGNTGVVSGVVVLAHLIPSLAVTVRRLHDIDRTGWWALIGLIPLLGSIVLLVFSCTASTQGPNRFGPPVGEWELAPVSTTRVEPGAARVSSSVNLDQIEKLAALRASGAIDEEEFKQMKAKALSLGPS